MLWRTDSRVRGLSCSRACGIIPSQGVNLCALHWRVDSQQLDQQGSLPPLSFSLSYVYISQFSSVAQSCLTLCDPMDAAHQASLSITNSRSLLKLSSIESVMPSHHLILCHPLLLLPSIFPSIRVFSSESVLRIRWPKYWSICVYMGICLYIINTLYYHR